MTPQENLTAKLMTALSKSYLKVDAARASLMFKLSEIKTKAPHRKDWIEWLESLIKDLEDAKKEIEEIIK